MADTYASGVQYNRGTGTIQRANDGYGLDEAPTAGKVKDGLSYGGYAGEVVIGPDGQPQADYSHNGLNDAVNRYQSLGEVAAKRAAYRADYHTANQDLAHAEATRNEGLRAMAGLQASAAGNGPTATTAMGQAMADQGMQGALAMGAGARGGLAQAAAGQAAYGQMYGQGVQGAGHLAGMRADEMGVARGAYMGGATDMRQHDLLSQGMLQRRATTQADAEIAQAQMNQQRQMGMEGLAYAARQAQLAAQQKQDETDANIYGNSLQIQNQEKNRTMANVAAGYQTGGTFVAGLSDMGRGGRGGGGGGYQGSPIQRDDPYGQQQEEDDGSDPYGGIGR